MQATHAKSDVAASIDVATAMASPRPSTQDRVIVHRLEERLVIVVADGAGGISGGAEAADAVCMLVDDALKHRSFDPMSAGNWVELLREADVALERDAVCGETTAIVAAVSERHGIVGASAGDSKAIVIEDEKNPLPADDLTEHQRKMRIGSGMAAPVQFHRRRLRGRLLVATDGLFICATWPEIARAAMAGKDLGASARGLVELARMPAEFLADDVAIALVGWTAGRPLV